MTLPIGTLITFFMASILLGLAPGPDNIFVLTQAALHGKRSGLTIMLGLCTGLIVHTIAVALGVALVFQTSVIAFSVLKFIGASYLLYLAWHAFRASAQKIQNRDDGIVDFRKFYLRGIIMNITNPKVSIFFLAFLQQFTDPTKGSVTLQILLLGGLFIVATILVFGGIAVLAGALGQLLTRSDRTQNILNKIAGTVFLSLALKLAITQR